MRKIPNYLDDPAQLLFWELDEFLLLSIMFAVGIMVNFLLTLVVIGIILVKYYRKMKDRRSNGFMLHVVYWYTGIGSSDKFPSSLPNPFIHRFF